MAVSSVMVPIGTPAPDFSLPDCRSSDPAQGAIYRRDDFASAPALLVAFLCNHCPYVRHIEAGFGRLVRHYPDLAVVGICPNDSVAYPEDSAARLAEQAVRADWRFPYLVDETQEVARAYQAACTPDFFLYGADRRLVYRGAMDASTPSNGLPVSGNLLRAAIEAALAGAPVPEPHRPSMGCSIKWRS